MNDEYCNDGEESTPTTTGGVAKYETMIRRCEIELSLERISCHHSPTSKNAQPWFNHENNLNVDFA